MERPHPRKGLGAFFSDLGKDEPFQTVSMASGAVLSSEPKKQLRGFIFVMLG
jgi:hypothetical protein